MSKYKIIAFLLFFWGHIVSCLANNEVIIQNETLQKNIVSLEGDWQFYFGGHLSASEMKNLAATKKHFISVPQNWATLHINGRSIPALGIATYYRRVVVKHNKANSGNRYALYIGHVSLAYKLWVNDELIGGIGSLGTNTSDFVPMIYPRYFSFTGRTDTLDIVFHVSNFIQPNNSGISQFVFFGEDTTLERVVLTKIVLASLVLCILFLTFIHQGVLSITNPLERSHIFLALLSLLFLAKTSLDGDCLLISHFIPYINFQIAYRVWLMSLLCIPIILKLMSIAYPEEVNQWIRKIIYGFYLVYLILVWSLHFQFLAFHAVVGVYVSFVFVGYLFYVIVRAVGRHQKYAILHLISLVVMLLMVVNDLVFVTNHHGFWYLSQVGAACYVMVQKIIISVKLSKYHKQTVDLSCKLENTNQMLEDTVTQRTRSLYLVNEELLKINKQKDILISTISHDLNNCFNTLLVFTKTLSDDTSFSVKYQSMMKHLYQASSSGYAILENILAWAKLRSEYHPQMQLIDMLSYIVDENVRLQAYRIEEKDLDVRVDIDNALLFQCDEGALNTILRNLLSNAIKFSYRGGVIWISNSLSDGRVRISVQNLGKGIATAHYTSLFCSQQEINNSGTEGEKGMGIGLMIIKELLECNNGKINCISIPEHGCSFIVEFDNVI